MALYTALNEMMAKQKDGEQDNLQDLSVIATRMKPIERIYADTIERILIRIFRLIETDSVV